MDSLTRTKINNIIKNLDEIKFDGYKFDRINFVNPETHDILTFDTDNIDNIDNIIADTTDMSEKGISKAVRSDNFSDTSVLPRILQGGNQHNSQDNSFDTLDSITEFRPNVLEGGNLGIYSSPRYSDTLGSVMEMKNSISSTINNSSKNNFVYTESSVDMDIFRKKIQR